MTTRTALCHQLQQLDGKGYKAYKAIQGTYAFEQFTLHIDYVQGDPFAAPSRVRVQVPSAVAGFAPPLWRTPQRAIALADYLTRQAHRAARTLARRSGSGKSGLISVVEPRQAVLNRSTAQVSAAGVELRLTVGLPAFGRRIAGRQAADLLGEALPQLVEQSLLAQSLDRAAIEHHLTTVDTAIALRQQLSQHNLIAFVANGSVLPRRSGIDPRPLTTQALPFTAPPSLTVTLDLPDGGTVSGLGIPAGITLIVGGGYHGKSTLLQALQMGIYNHIPGDGREQVVSQPPMVKVRAEDGRSIAGVDISPFIDHLPQGKSTRQFSTTNASGSTSQAASIMEAVEAGAKVLLLDEDTCATNFMIRDRRMQALIAKGREPITPFIDKVRQLYTDHGVSSILVMGGSGDYFDVADTVIALDEFVPQDVTQQAQAIAAQYQTQRQPEGGQHFGAITYRCPDRHSIDAGKGRRAVNLKVRDVDELVLGETAIDLSAVEQLVEVGQVRAIGAALVYAQTHYMADGVPLATVIERVLADVSQHSLDALSDWPTGDLAEFRGLELAAAINRLRGVVMGG